MKETEKTIARQIVENPIRVHCGYHKCLTMYSRRTYTRACSVALGAPRGFRHFYHKFQDFIENCDRYRITSISGYALNLDRFRDIKVVRFIRDPRDLLVSGYHYHRRGTEHWTRIKSPTQDDFQEVRGVVPERLGPEMCMMEYVNTAPHDEGMRAELEFRRLHFESMREWPIEDPRVALFRYEDFLGNEMEVYSQAMKHLDLPRISRAYGLISVYRHSAKRRQSRDPHIRDARSGQWREQLPADVIRSVAENYGDVLERYGYPID